MSACLGARRAVIVLLCASLSGCASAADSKPYVPEVGQIGKDVIWVPTPPELVERMLDLAAVTPQDFVIDLGSGDGRNVIAAAKRGARARGVEYNPDMVALSRRTAADAGVSDKAEFVQGDMFAADISEATVMALFLLPSNLLQLRSKLFNLTPGSRIVANTFAIQDWQPDATNTLPGCRTWCTALLWIVPAKVEGTWRTTGGDLVLTQQFQMVAGTLAGTPVSGRLRGTEIAFKAGEVDYTAHVVDDVMEGSMGGGAAWSARRP